MFFDQGQLVVITNGFQKNKQKTPKKEIEKAIKINEEYEAEKNNITTLEHFKDKHCGNPGTEKRDKLEAGYENFKIGALIYEVRCEKG